MFFANASSDTTISVTVITTIGLIVVALIGWVTAKTTSNAKKDAQINAEEASRSAQMARDYAAALGAKDALISSIEARLIFVEEHDDACTKRLEELEVRVEEGEEQRRAASVIERSQSAEIDELREEIERLKKKR